MSNDGAHQFGLYKMSNGGISSIFKIIYSIGKAEMISCSWTSGVCCSATVVSGCLLVCSRMWKLVDPSGLRFSGVWSSLGNFCHSLPKFSTWDFTFWLGVVWTC